MKKTYFRISVVAMSLAASIAVQAATPTAELKVKGEITAPTCNVVAPDGGVYDFGKISTAMIKTTGFTLLSEQTKTWTVNCDAETYLSFTAIDNRASSASIDATTLFGLGHVNGTGKIGYYTATLSAPKVDGSSVKLFAVAAGSGTFGAADTVDITKNTTNIHMGWASAANTLKSGQVFSADISVKPVLASVSTMGGPITDSVDLDGLMTMGFAFGL